MVIEVAVSTLEKDRLKAGIYASIEVPEYWIVDGLAKRIEVLTRLAPDLKEYKERIVPIFYLPTKATGMINTLELYY